ncbi:DUF3068 domain-containing protein [Actinomadura hibisca]|uniref:DUF3068 domain-containing protein n=1 Tax=Actinomadura hibisca TaxID=68565 RepID=UPI000831AF26|nr:DUF3068 domain-containing protein [Actinomadura hibisca]
MRRPLSLILIALGAFCLTLAPLVKLYVADKTVVAPLNRYQRTQLEAQDALYFDMAKLKTRKGVTLVADNTVRGDVRANNGNDRIAVWDSSTNIYDKTAPDKQIDIQSYRIAFDRKTSELTNCCGTHVGGDGSVKMAGYGLLYPLAHVEKRDYPFFDMSTRQQVPMRFSGEEEIAGIDAYRFVQQVPPSKTGKIDFKVPGDLLGLGEKSAAQQVDRYFEASITQWVDPRTGVPVRIEQKINSFVQTPDGRGRLTVAQADLKTTAASQAGLVKLANENALKIAMVRTYVPYGAVAVGVLLLALGVLVGWLAASRRKAESDAAPAPKAPRRPDGKFGDGAPAAAGQGGPAAPGKPASPRGPDGKFGGLPAAPTKPGVPPPSEDKRVAPTGPAKPVAPAASGGGKPPAGEQAKPAPGDKTPPKGRSAPRRLGRR